MAGMQIRLLGTFSLLKDREPVRLESPAAPTLLQQMLAMRPDPLPAGQADSGALAELRTLLSVHEDQQGFLRLDTDRVWIDADVFLARFRAGKRSAVRGDMVPAVLAFQEAEELYKGPFLSGMEAPWAEAPRKRLAEAYEEVLQRLADGYAVLNRYGQAIAYCQKALALNPRDEEVHQRLIVYAYYQGGLARAREAYQASLRALGKPSLETEALWQRLSEAEAAAAAE